MSASLVGSEMCIRDRNKPCAGRVHGPTPGSVSQATRPVTVGEVLLGAWVKPSNQRCGSEPLTG
eukprot:1235997-Alexandrium_andersonii.AAC.1